MRNSLPRALAMQGLKFLKKTERKQGMAERRMK